jgi:hypothetical protein
MIAPRQAARILAAVGKSTDDEVQLATDIFEACVTTLSKLDPQGGSKAAKRLQKVKDIRKAVEKHAALISADPFLRKTIGKAEGVKPPPIFELCIDYKALKFNYRRSPKSGVAKLTCLPS